MLLFSSNEENVPHALSLFENTSKAIVRCKSHELRIIKPFLKTKTRGSQRMLSNVMHPSVLCEAVIDHGKVLKKRADHRDERQPKVEDEMGGMGTKMS
ncbi:unnamed protein product [Schistosoma mattheei]|uniref:Uncharacterized protein n=1 Tax=Schistosoma mattheei TaxID=31246 RepID=A0A183NJJ9_9TREM|nr:unnamed protein product [Schistosoma mattheei]